MSDPQFDETMPLPQPDAAQPETAAKPEAARAAAPTSMDLVGKQIDDFRVLRKLGAGAMAEVFLAEQVSLNRQVALKVLKPELVDESDDTHLKRFKQEATAAANLSHPNIVQVYAVGEQAGVHYIAQEYVPGLTLREWLRKNGPPEPLIAIKLLRQVALALQAASEAGIVHRDIKPENVLLTKKGDAKVADFGLAQLAQTGERVQLTQIGMTMGTPLYMSPEQVAGRSVDHRSDLYSLGVTAYHLLAGSPPFRGETALSVAVQHLNAPAEPLQKVRPDLPIALCELVQKVMDKRPEYRYQSAADLAEDLRKLGVAFKTDPAGAAKKGLNSFTVAKTTPASKRLPGIDQFFDWSARKHAKVLAGVGVIVLVLSVGLGWATRPVDPFTLAAEEQPYGIPPEANARAQYNRAIFPGTNEEYEAVRRYFPRDTVWTPRATMRLGLNHLYDGDFAGAEELFGELQVSSDARTRIDGAAGQVIVAAALNDTAEFKRRMSFLVSELSKQNTSERSIHSELRRLLEGFRERKELQAQIDLLLGDSDSTDSAAGEVPPSEAGPSPAQPDENADP